MRGFTVTAISENSSFLAKSLYRIEYNFHYVLRKWKLYLNENRERSSKTNFFDNTNANVML